MLRGGYDTGDRVEVALEGEGAERALAFSKV
jgi:hypothetical protein